jgi:HAD superfamily hydrolase (TIGR01459 family)
MNFIKGIKDIIDDYDYYIFDVWGVIHDGVEAYPQAKETIEYLRNNGKKICFLSNAPRRASKVAGVIKNYGIDKNLYDFILTSGETFYLDFQENQKRKYKNYGKNYLYIGPKKDLDLLDGLKYNMVDSAGEADFAIVTGFDDEDSEIEEKMPQAVDAISHGLELICVNPDLVVVRQDGTEMICAGALGKKYQELGGEVTYYGKPHNKTYKKLSQLFDSGCKKERMLAIGDALETDIKGANNFGIDSLLLTGGILSNKLNVKFNEQADPKNLEIICKKEKIFSKYVCSNLKI